MTIEEIIYKHLIEFRYNYRKGLINKLLIILLVISLPVNYFYDTIVDAVKNHPDQLFHITLIILCLFSPAFIIGILLKPMNLLLSSTLKNSKLLFKEDIFNHIKENIPEIQEMLAFQKISCSEVLESGLFAIKDYDFEGDDWMRGNYRDVPFMLSEINLFRYYKSYFYGAFVICDLNKTYPETIVIFQPNQTELSCELISTDTIIQIKKYCDDNELQINLSIKNNKLYIALWRHRNIFENTTKKAINNLGSDYDIFKSNIIIINSIIDDLL